MLDLVGRGGSGWLGLQHYFRLLALQASTVTYIFSTVRGHGLEILRLRLGDPTGFIA